MPRSPTRNDAAPRGFTMVEMMVVIIILAIAAVMVLPYAIGTSSLKAQSAARMAMADLEWAQNQAIVLQSEVTVTFSVPGNSYTIAKQSQTLKHPITHNDFVVDFDTRQDLHGVSIVSAAFGGTPQVTFKALGEPESAGSVVLAAGAHTYQVTVTPVTGRITVTAIP